MLYFLLFQECSDLHGSFDAWNIMTPVFLVCFPSPIQWSESPPDLCSLALFIGHRHTSHDTCSSSANWITPLSCKHLICDISRLKDRWDTDTLRAFNYSVVMRGNTDWVFFFPRHKNRSLRHRFLCTAKWILSYMRSKAMVEKSHSLIQRKRATLAKRTHRSPASVDRATTLVPFKDNHWGNVASKSKWPSPVSVLPLPPLISSTYSGEAFMGVVQTTKALPDTPLASFLLTAAEALWNSRNSDVLVFTREVQRNSGAMGAMQCIKYLMFIFNFLFWVCSAAFMYHSHLRSKLEGFLSDF